MIKSIREFGACGDGIHDDTPALKLALQYSGTVFFPAGIYIIREQLSAKGISLHWCGEGEQSILRLLPADTARTADTFHKEHKKKVFSTRLLLLQNCGHIELRGLKVDANKVAFDADICKNGSCRYDHTTCLDIWGAESVVLEDTTFRGGLIEGVYIDHTANIRIHGCRFLENGFAGEDASGIQIAAPVPGTPAIFISDCTFSRNGFNGLELNGIDGAVISNVVCSHNGIDGIAFWNGSSRCELNGVLAEGNQRGGITFRRNDSAGNADILLDSARFCSDITINGLVTAGNRFGICWGCAENIVINGWNGTDRFNHMLCYLYPEKDITAVITGAHLQPAEQDIHNPVLTEADEALYDKFGAVPLSDAARFRPCFLP